uniref:Uncharacterized protein n=1 Tax=Arundo donax TaxID=35708 RepID=A0A0A9H2A1_ARUDO
MSVLRSLLGSAPAPPPEA